MDRGREEEMAYYGAVAEYVFSECPSCGKGKRENRAYCGECMKRWRKAGEPEGGPPPSHWDPEGGMEDLQEIWRYGMTMADAAAKLGRSARTIERYKKRLRQRGIILEGSDRATVQRHRHHQS